jgi:hypothetical protein
MNTQLDALVRTVKKSYSQEINFESSLYPRWAREYRNGLIEEGYVVELPKDAEIAALHTTAARTDSIMAIMDAVKAAIAYENRGTVNTGGLGDINRLQRLQIHPVCGPMYNFEKNRLADIDLELKLIESRRGVMGMDTSIEDLVKRLVISNWYINYLD